VYILQNGKEKKNEDKPLIINQILAYILYSLLFLAYVLCTLFFLEGFIPLGFSNKVFKEAHAEREILSWSRDQLIAIWSQPINM